MEILLLSAIAVAVEPELMRKYPETATVNATEACQFNVKLWRLGTPPNVR